MLNCLIRVFPLRRKRGVAMLALFLIDNLIVRFRQKRIVQQAAGQFPDFIIKTLCLFLQRTVRKIVLKKKFNQPK